LVIVIYPVVVPNRWSRFILRLDRLVSEPQHNPWIDLPSTWLQQLPSTSAD